MKKLNCWEILKCGREPGGKYAEEAGVCPAVIHTGSDGTNSGTNAGRYCWRIAGTCCDGQVQGRFAAKVEDCGQCEVFVRVMREEGPDFKL